MHGGKFMQKLVFKIQVTRAILAFLIKHHLFLHQNKLLWFYKLSCRSKDERDTAIRFPCHGFGILDTVQYLFVCLKISAFCHRCPSDHSYILNGLGKYEWVTKRNWSCTLFVHEIISYGQKVLFYGYYQGDNTNKMSPLLQCLHGVGH